MEKENQNLLKEFLGSFKNFKLEKVRLLFTIYDFSGEKSTLIKKLGNKGRPKMDFFGKGYKIGDFFENIYYIYEDTKEKGKSFKENLKSCVTLENTKLQLCVYYKKLISIHLEFIVENTYSKLTFEELKQIICEVLYENNYELLSLITKIFEFYGISYLLPNEFFSSLRNSMMRPIVSFVVSYNHNSNDKKVYNTEKIFLNSAPIFLLANPNVNQNNFLSHYDYIKKIEETIAQNLFTCFKIYKNYKINILYTQEYIQKILEFAVREDNKKEVIALIKSFLGFRKNGVLRYQTKENKKDLNEILDNILSSLNFISLIISLIQTLDGALTKKIIELGEREKPLEFIIDEIEDIYIHTLLISPYTIKHISSITSWSLPEELVLMTYNIVENILSTVNSMYLSSLRRMQNIKFLLDGK